jgi:hypothetical protein
MHYHLGKLNFKIVDMGNLQRLCKKHVKKMVAQWQDGYPT